MEKVLRNLRTLLVANKQLLAIIFAGFCGLLILAQLVYPTSRLLPFTSIDGQSFGIQPKSNVLHKLDSAQQARTMELYFGTVSKPQFTPKLSDVGVQVTHNDRLSRLQYPWYIRLIPGSILWYGALQTAPAPAVHRDSKKLDAYMHKQLANACDVKPTNASLKIENTTAVLVPASNGGTCQANDVRQKLQTAAISATNNTVVRISMKVVPPTLGDEKAQALADILNKQLAGVLQITAGTSTINVDAATVAGWLVFKPTEQDLILEIATEKAADFFAKQLTPKVAIAAGTTHIVTRDFIEIARTTGTSGRTLDIPATTISIQNYLTGKGTKITAATRVLPPRLTYSRSYSSTDAGLSALIKHYAETHSGTYGVQLVELYGNRRRAAYNEDHQFRSASTYKLFVAYGALQKIERGEWSWTDNVTGGRNLQKCFDDMIVKSDNPCAETLLDRYGRSNLTNAIQGLGLSNSRFANDSPYTTALDLSIFLGMLQGGQLFTQQSSTDTLLNAMRRNQYRQGIPAGASGAVADKVGFLDGLLHDAAIVYAPSGNYVLVIMTQGSSWGAIADLTREIEKL